MSEKKTLAWLLVLSIVLNFVGVDVISIHHSFQLTISDLAVGSILSDNSGGRRSKDQGSISKLHLLHAPRARKRVLPVNGTGTGNLKVRDR